MPTNPHSKLARYVALGLFAFFGVHGIYGGIQQLGQFRTTGQLVQTLTQLGYGITGLCSVISIARKHSAPRTLTILWVTFMSLAGGLAPMTWGSSSMLFSLVCFVIGGSIGLVSAWIAPAGARRNVA